MSCELGLLDRFFAERVLKEEYSDERAHFLSTLMHLSRQGDLCWKCPTAPSLPPSVLGEGKELEPKVPVVREGDRYYLQRNWVYETYILQQIKRLRNQPPPSCHSAEVFEREWEQARLTPQQKRAVREIFASSFSLICGGPGTGKTYTASVLVRLLVASTAKKKYRVILTAPTGKAASHLEEVLLGQEIASAKVEVMTLHRLLRLSPQENSLFALRKIDADLVIVDEASMIDVPLLAHLLEAIGPTTRLVLMGDPDQLPPVEASSLFAEMASLFATPLKGSLRTEKKDLHVLAEAINQGEFEAVSRTLLPWTFDASLVSKLYSQLNPLRSEKEIQPEEALLQLNHFRVLGALRQGPFGTDWLNQQILQEMSRDLQTGQWWAVPLMITKNEPRLDLYNGTCGVLIGRSRGGLYLRDSIAYFPEKVDFKDLPPFEIAFCLSVHKSQGSEFDRVLALFPTGSENFGREALYTAVTRAKSQVDLVADEEILRQMLSRHSRRASGFAERFTRLFAASS